MSNDSILIFERYMNVLTEGGTSTFGRTTGLKGGKSPTSDVYGVSPDTELSSAAHQASWDQTFENDLSQAEENGEFTTIDDIISNTENPKKKEQLQAMYDALPEDSKIKTFNGVIYDFLIINIIDDMDSVIRQFTPVSHPGDEQSFNITSKPEEVGARYLRNYLIARALGNAITTPSVTEKIKESGLSGINPNSLNPIQRKDFLDKFLKFASNTMNQYRSYEKRPHAVGGSRQKLRQANKPRTTEGGEGGQANIMPTGSSDLKHLRKTFGADIDAPIGDFSGEDPTGERKRKDPMKRLYKPISHTTPKNVAPSVGEYIQSPEKQPETPKPKAKAPTKTQAKPKAKASRKKLKESTEYDFFKIIPF